MISGSSQTRTTGLLSANFMRGIVLGELLTMVYTLIWQVMRLGPRVKERCCRVTSLLVYFNRFAGKRASEVEDLGQ